MLIIWTLVFVVSLVALVKGADWLIESAEKIGLAFGMTPFVVGAVIVGAGTSFPELVSSLAAVGKGVTDVVVANAIGSNIANILLIVGISAIISRRLFVTKNLINLDLPLLAISTVLLLGVVWDQQVTLGESIILLVAYGIYLLYTLFHKEDEMETNAWQEMLPSRKERRGQLSLQKENIVARPKLVVKDFILLLVGILALVLGAEYLIEALINLSTLLNVGTGMIAITAVAIGTSLPELMVSAKAAFRHKSDVALGNIFGSNVFNALVVVGLPGLFGTLAVDSQTFIIGVPAVAFATLIFIISAISRKVYIWEGVFFLLLYVLFIAKLFNWF